VDAGVKRFLLFAAALALTVGAVLLVVERVRRAANPDPTTIANVSLQALREQNRLTPFAARFVAVVTSEQTRLGFKAKKTLILPGNVRYEIDLAKLDAKSLSWDGATKTLSVTLPPVEVAGPDIDIRAIREYDSGGVLMAVTNAESTLDAANRRVGTDSLLRQAHSPVTMQLAREAARTAVARNLALPLRVAGIEAKVVARFADETRKPGPAMDGSTPLSEIYAH
jgi:ABC-type amino acid transport substrate-binding protein